MARKKQEDPPPPGAPAWMATYGDMMTLVLCFFVLLFSMSSIDASKFQELVQSFNDVFSINIESSSQSTLSFGDLAGSGLAQLPDAGTGLQTSQTDMSVSRQQTAQMASDFKTYLAKNQISDKVAVEQSDEYIKLIFTDKILFDTGKATLKPDAYAVLDLVTNEILKYSDNDIKIEGHTDDMPIATVQFPSNWELSAVRSITVAKYLINDKGFSPFRISTEGFGEYRPLYPNSSDENRAFNRRVEIKIMSKASSSAAPTAVPTI